MYEIPQIGGLLAPIFRYLDERQILGAWIVVIPAGVLMYFISIRNRSKTRKFSMSEKVRIGVFVWIVICCIAAQIGMIISPPKMP